jgi:hypothetical protein
LIASVEHIDNTPDGENQMMRSVRQIATAATFLVVSAAVVPAFAQSAPAPGAIPAAPEPAATAPAAAAPDVLPGPMLDQRKQLFMHLQQAGEHGIGTANYMMAFKAVEQQVANGATEPQIKSRVDQLNNALIEQLKRAQVLKSQRPLPPTASQAGEYGNGGGGAPTASGGGAGPAAGGGGGGGGGINLDKLKEKLGGIDIPDSLKEQLMNSDKAKALLKKLGQ